jgi:hypothetical protein
VGLVYQPRVLTFGGKGFDKGTLILYNKQQVESSNVCDHDFA